MTKVYFSGAISAGKEFAELHRDLIRLIKELGHTVLTADIDWDDNSKETPQEIFRRDYHALLYCDCVVAEVSIPSHGVGMEMGYAATWGKPIMVLHRNRVSPMISGNLGIICLEYCDIDEVVAPLGHFLNHCMSWR